MYKYLDQDRVIVFVVWMIFMKYKSSYELKTGDERRV